MPIGTPSALSQETLSSADDPETGYASITTTAGATLYLAVAKKQTDGITLGTDGAGTPVGQPTSLYLGHYMNVYRWTNVSGGTQSISVNWNGSAPFEHEALFAVQVTGVDTTTPNDTPVTSSLDGSSSGSINVGSASGDVVLAFVWSAASMTHGDTQVGSNQQRGTTGEYLGVSYNTSGAGTVNMDWSGLSNQTIMLGFNLNVAAGGSIELVVAELTSATTLDNVALTQAHNLAVDALTASTTLDNVSLTQANVLAVDELTAATSLDNIALTQAYVLAVDALTAATSLDNVALTQSNVLAVGDLLAATTLDNVALTQAHVLAVSDLLAAATLDTPSLTQANVLAVNALLSGTTLDGVELDQSTALTVADLLSGTTMDAPSLTQANVLTVGDLLSATTLDSPSLTQAHVLAVQDLTSGPTLDNIVLVLPAGALSLTPPYLLYFVDPARVLLVTDPGRAIQVTDPARTLTWRTDG